MVVNILIPHQLINIYNVGDAKNGINSVVNLSAGTYYVYKIYDNMINVSKTPEVPGAWINPGVKVTQGATKATSVNSWNTILVNPWNKLPSNFDVNLSYVEDGYRVDSRI